MEGARITVLLFCMMYAETRNRTEWDGIFLVTISTVESNVASNMIQTADDTSTLLFNPGREMSFIEPY